MIFRYICFVNSLQKNEGKLVFEIASHQMLGTGVLISIIKTYCAIMATY